MEAIVLISGGTSSPSRLHFVRWSNILIGVLLIYGAYLVRAFRWVVFLRPTKRLPPLYLLGTQVIGFTAVALLGRVADLTRPYLVARRSKLPIALQIAIYTVERMFDVCSMATIVGVASAAGSEQGDHAAPRDGDGRRQELR